MSVGPGASAAAGPAGAAPVPRRAARVSAACALLPAAAALAFLPVLGNGFVQWDDDANFLQNPHYRGLGWAQLRWAWTSSRLGVYQPLSWMALEAEYALWGLDPRGYHLTSLVLHAANAVALYALILGLLDRARGAAVAARAGLGAAPAAAIAAALFAAHPMRTEVVAWASCQPYLPCALLAMLAVIAYLRAHPEGGPARPAWLAAAWALYTAALLSKAVAVGVFVVFPLLDAYPLRRLGPGPGGRGAAWAEKVPFALLTAAFVALAVLSRGVDDPNVPGPPPGPAARVAQACYGACFYLVKSAVPAGLSAFYPRPGRLELASPRFLGAMAATAGLTAWLYHRRRARPGLLVAWLAYLAILSPNLGLVGQATNLVADRYSYVPSLALTPLLAAGLCGLRGGAPARTGAALGLAAAVALGGLSWSQCLVWRSTEALFAQALAHGGRSALMENNLGAERLERGDAAGAERLFREALREEPGHAAAHNNLGLALEQRGAYDEARRHFAESARCDPEFAPARTNLGRALARMGRLEEAIAEHRRAVRLDPESAEAREELARALLLRGRADDAAAQLAEAIRLRPDSAGAHRDLGLLLARRGRPEEAAAHLSEAIRLRPDSAEAHAGLGTVLARRGRHDEAVRELSEAVRLRPEMVDARFNLGTALAEMGQPDRAAAELAEVLRLRPDHPLARAALARARARAAGGGGPGGRPRTPAGRPRPRAGDPSP